MNYIPGKPNLTRIPRFFLQGKRILESSPNYTGGRRGGALCVFSTEREECQVKVITYISREIWFMCQLSTNGQFMSTCRLLGSELRNQDFTPSSSVVAIRHLPHKIKDAPSTAIHTHNRHQVQDEDNTVAIQKLETKHKDFPTHLTRFFLRKVFNETTFLSLSLYTKQKCSGELEITHMHIYIYRYIMQIKKYILYMNSTQCTYSLQNRAVDQWEVLVMKMHDPFCGLSMLMMDLTCRWDCTSHPCHIVGIVTIVPNYLSHIRIFHFHE